MNVITLRVTYSYNVIRCFADDMTLLQQDLSTVIEWSICNNMALHEDKIDDMNHCVNTPNAL